MPQCKTADHIIKSLIFLRMQCMASVNYTVHYFHDNLTANYTKIYWFIQIKKRTFLFRGKNLNHFLVKRLRMTLPPYNAKCRHLTTTTSNWLNPWPFRTNIYYPSSTSLTKDSKMSCLQYMYIKSPGCCSSLRPSPQVNGRLRP